VYKALDNTEEELPHEDINGQENEFSFDEWAKELKLPKKVIACFRQEEIAAKLH